VDALKQHEQGAQLALYDEYHQVAPNFRYIVETERRYYLANNVDLQVKNTNQDVYFEVLLDDVWVWDVHRSQRHLKHVHIVTFKDVNIEEVGV
jgi:hypothetical protein